MRQTWTIFVILLFAPAAARGQSADGPIARADVAVSAGWFAADRSVQQDCCSMWAAGLFKGAAAGYYWTDHLKTEASIASPGNTDGYNSSSERLPSGSYRYTSEQHHVDGTKISIAQVYQFGRNSTFHPFAVGGVDIDRERDAIDRYVSTTTSAARETRVETSTRARVFVGAGFKAYFSERAFFKGEARFAGGERFDQMRWTGGVGVDLGGRRSSAPVVEPPSHAVPRGQEPVDVWRSYAAQLKTGSLVDVRPAGDDHFIAEFVAADADGILVRPAGRVAEPVRHLTFERLETLALHDGPRPGARVGATFAGIGAGAGTFAVLLVALLSHFGG